MKKSDTMIQHRPLSRKLIAAFITKTKLWQTVDRFNFIAVFDPKNKTFVGLIPVSATHNNTVNRQTLKRLGVL